MTQTNKGCLGSIFSLLGGQSQTRPTVRYIPADDNIDDMLPESMPYRVRDNFLSPTELSFYHVLRGVAGERAVVCPEMNLSSIFFVARPNENQSFRARIAQKSIDFLLCEPKTMKPLAGIELDDTSHARPDRQARDEFVNKVFEAAELPLLRIPAQRTYVTAEIAKQLEPFIELAVQVPAAQPMIPVPGAASPSPAASPQIPAAAIAEPPLCPKCGISMVLRTGSQGQHKGRQFYGCQNYPQCRQMLPYTELKTHGA